MSIEFIEEDLLESKSDVIAHQCNCVTLKYHGLSEDINKKYPYFDIYEKRKPKGNSRNISELSSRNEPGTCILMRPNNKKDGPIVACLMAQIAPGKPGSWANTYNVDMEMDTYQKRREYFAKSLKDLLIQCKKDGNIKSISFPFKIGCGLAGGNWQDYSSMLNQFSRNIQHADIKVYVSIPKKLNENI